MRALIILALLAGCANHPLDCALGNSFGPGYCQEGTRGYENQEAGRGVSFNPNAAALILMARPQPYIIPPIPAPQPVRIQPFTCMNMGGGMVSCQ